jgi:hypothetical protein
VQIINDIERTKNEIAAAEKRQQEIASQVQQAKQGKEDSVGSVAALLIGAATLKYMIAKKLERLALDCLAGQLACWLIAPLLRQSTGCAGAVTYKMWEGQQVAPPAPT